MLMLDKINTEQIFGDKDILLVGDYNSYTYEQPLQTIVAAGYEDILMQHAPTGYSYVYHSEAGYLDRAFASPTMAAQVVTVQPYHLNADYFYSRGFKRGLDDTMFRYADHDPILIYVKLGYRWSGIGYRRWAVSRALLDHLDRLDYLDIAPQDTLNSSRRGDINY